MVIVSFVLFFMALTFSTINVRSVRTKMRAQSVLSFLNTVTSDVILLQECAIPFLKAYNQWQDMWPQPSIWSGSNENKNDGVAVLVKKTLCAGKGEHCGEGRKSPPSEFELYGQGF